MSPPLNGQTKLIAPREAFGLALAELGHTHPNLVVLDADLASSTKTDLFQARFPARFFQMGIAEQNMIGVAAGLAHQGLIPVVSTFAAFATRAWEQFRLSIAVPKLNVTLVATHAGITVGADGVSAQMTEDIALIRSLPQVSLISPADAVETKLALQAAIKHPGPVYLRLGRPEVPLIHPASYRFTLGRADILCPGRDVTLIATGFMVHLSLQAATILESQGISAEVINLSTLKPLDQKTILKSAAHTQAVVTAEDHQQAGGLGSAVAEILAQNLPTPLEIVALEDVFGESGKPEELLTKFGLTAPDIVQASHRVLARKTGQLSSPLTLKRYKLNRSLI